MTYLLRVSTRKLDATDTEPDRIAVTLSDGRSMTHPYPYRLGLDGIEAHEHCIAQTLGKEESDRIESVYMVNTTERGYKFTIFMKEDWGQ